MDYPGFAKTGLARCCKSLPHGGYKDPIFLAKRVAWAELNKLI